jgi:hypothetical protein
MYWEGGGLREREAVHQGMGPFIEGRDCSLRDGGDQLFIEGGRGPFIEGGRNLFIHQGRFVHWGREGSILRGREGAICSSIEGGWLSIHWGREGIIHPLREGDHPLRDGEIIHWGREVSEAIRQLTSGKEEQSISLLGKSKFNMIEWCQSFNGLQQIAALLFFAEDFLTSYYMCSTYLKNLYWPASLVGGASC